MLCRRDRSRARRFQAAFWATVLGATSLMGAEPSRTVARIAPRVATTGGHLPDESHPYDHMGRFVVLGNRLVLQATDGVNGSQIWATDGTTAGTVVLHPGDSAWNAQSAGLTQLGHVALFTAMGASALWKTDGTPEGTSLLKKVVAFPIAGAFGDLAGSPYQTFTVMGGRAFFVGWQESSGLQLWRTDGTTKGTVPVKGGLSFGFPFVPAGPQGPLLFRGRPGSTGLDSLYSSDGTTPGTKLLKKGVEMYAPVVAARKVFFYGNTLFDREIWVSDGTPGGTRRLTHYSGVDVAVQCCGGPASSGSHAFFVVIVANGFELWASDGTAAGTRVVLEDPMDSDILLALNNPGGRWAALKGRLLWVSRTGSQHRLWQTDGTPEGTHVVKDLGDADLVTGLQVAADRLYFTRRTGSSSEVWMSDGTESGTRPVASLSHTEQPLFLPGGMARLGPWLLFGAHNETQGDSPGGELWAMPAPVDVSVLDTRAGSACGATAEFRVGLSGPSEEPITVEYATADGSAREGLDYESTRGTLSFAPGSTSGLVQVPVRCRAAAAPRVFYLDISSPTNASVVRSRATAWLGGNGPGPSR